MEGVLRPRWGIKLLGEEEAHQNLSDQPWKWSLRWDNAGVKCAVIFCRLLSASLSCLLSRDSHGTCVRIVK